MKRLITAVILPFFCLALAVSSAVYTDRTLTKSINEIERMEDENEFELSRAHNLFGVCKKDKKLLAILLKHEDVDEIEMNLNDIVYAAKTQSDDYKDVLDKARGFLTGVRDGEKLSFQSIF